MPPPIMVAIDSKPMELKVLLLLLDPWPNVVTTPNTTIRSRQCLPLSVVQLKGKHCRKPHCRDRVVDTFGHNLLDFETVLRPCPQLLDQPGIDGDLFRKIRQDDDISQVSDPTFYVARLKDIKSLRLRYIANI